MQTPNVRKTEQAAPQSTETPVDEPAPVSPDLACTPDEAEEQPQGEAEVDDDAKPGNCVRHFPNQALEAHIIDALDSVKPRISRL